MRLGRLAAQRARIQQQQLLAAGQRVEPGPLSQEPLATRAEEEDSRPTDRFTGAILLIDCLLQ